MTRAVHFNGTTYLLNTTLGGISAFSSNLSCGVLSYWYKADTTLDATVLLAFANIPGGHCLRLVHYNPGGSSNVYPMLQLQRPQAVAGTSVFLLGGTTLPYDGDWHHVLFSWSVNTSPVVAKCQLDGASVTLSTPLPTLGAFTIDYSIADDWRIAGEYSSSPMGTYLGDLAEVYLQCLNIYIDPDASLGVSIGGVLVGGKGFRWNDNKAMEIGPDGSGALGQSGLVPQVYCTGDSGTFPSNGGGSRAFSITGTLATAGSDPFP